MSIFKNLERVHAAVVVDKIMGSGEPNENPGDLGAAIGVLAVDAITRGIGSDAWKKYMSLFADNAEQLNLLTVTSPDWEEAWIKEARAYMVANAVCAAATNTFTGNRVSPDLGSHLSETPDDEPAKFRPANLKIRDVKLV